MSLNLPLFKRKFTSLWHLRSERGTPFLLWRTSMSAVLFILNVLFFLCSKFWIARRRLDLQRLARCASLPLKCPWVVFASIYHWYVLSRFLRCIFFYFSLTQIGKFKKSPFLQVKSKSVRRGAAQQPKTVASRKKVRSPVLFYLRSRTCIIFLLLPLTLTMFVGL